MKIEPEDFRAWRDQPITEVVIKLMQKRSAECKTAWLTASWDKNECDPLLLADLRAKEQILSDLANLSYEDIKDED